MTSMRSGRSGGDILWVLLVSGWFCVAKTIIPEAGSTFSSLHHPATLTFSVDWGLAVVYHRVRHGDGCGSRRLRHSAKAGTLPGQTTRPVETAKQPGNHTDTPQTLSISARATAQNPTTAHGGRLRTTKYRQRARLTANWRGDSVASSTTGISAEKRTRTRASAS